MSDDTRPFFTLEEVRKYLAATNDRAFSNDKAIMQLIDTNQLTPYVKYKGLVSFVTQSISMNREPTINSLTNTIKTEMTKLEIGELTEPHYYDSALNVDSVIYLVKKLLSSFEDKFATKTAGANLFTEGVFKLSPLNIAQSASEIEVVLGDQRPISQAIWFDLNDPGLSDDEIEGYILYAIESDENQSVNLEKNCELLFAKHDLLYILSIIKNSNLIPKLETDLSSANRTINQQYKEIEKLKKELKKSQSQQPENDVKDSVYLLILVLKDLLLNPCINAFHFKSDSPKSTGKPTQTGLIEHIISKNIPKLGKRNIEEIFRLANKL